MATNAQTSNQYSGRVGADWVMASAIQSKSCALSLGAPGSRNAPDRRAAEPAEPHVLREERRNCAQSRYARERCFRSSAEKDRSEGSGLRPAAVDFRLTESSRDTFDGLSGLDAAPNAHRQILVHRQPILLLGLNDGPGVGAAPGGEQR